MTGTLDIVIRPAYEADATDISRVHVAVWRTTYQGVVPKEYLASLNTEERAERWRDNIRSGMHVFVATQQSSVVGFISGGAIREPVEDYDAELYAIYLLDDFQRGGIGTWLRQQLVSTLHAEGFRQMIAWVFQSNDAQVFYKRSGGRHVATRSIELGGAALAALAYGWDISPAEA